jgi:hypothetical protein
MKARALGLVTLCLALVAVAPVSAQQRDITGLLDEAQDAGTGPEDAGTGTGGEDAGAGAEDAGVGAEDAGAGTGTGAGTEDEPGEPAVPDEEEPALPEGHVPTITVRLTPESGLMTGDVVHYELTVEVPEGDDVNLPRQSYAPLELVGQDHAESTASGRRRFVYTLDLLALEPGELTIPALLVRVITADGVVGTVRTEPQHVSIGSLVANEPDAQPRPPTEPVVVMQDDYTLAYVAGALGLMLITALFTWLFLRWWRARPKELPPPPPPRPAHEVAMEKLRALRRELTPAIADGSQARIVDGASDALREYLGHRFGFNGLESTTDEVIARMRQQRLAGTTLAEITSLLGECDLVKFAKAIPDESDCDKVIGEAERIVQRTMHANVVAIAPPAAPSAPTMKEPALPDPAQAPRPEPLTAPAPAPEAAPESAVPVLEAAAVPVPVPESSAPAPESSEPTLPAGSRAIPLTNPPPAPDAQTIETLGTPSFAIPETPVPPPAPRDSDVDLTPAPPDLLLAKVADALAKASGAAAKPPDLLGKPSDLLGKPSEPLGKPSELLAKPSEPLAKPTEPLATPVGMTTAVFGGVERTSEDDVWTALDDAVAMDRLVVGKVIARREEGFLVGLGAGVHGVLPEAQLGGLDAEGLVGEERAFRVVSLNAGRKRVVLSHREVDAVAERALVGRATPIGFTDPHDARDAKPGGGQ